LTVVKSKFHKPKNYNAAVKIDKLGAPRILVDKEYASSAIIPYTELIHQSNFDVSVVVFVKRMFLYRIEFPMMPHHSFYYF
jgi:hypothetical protein